ncbi:MAG: type II toxin-antitoxin system RelE/ParE family toxin [Terriglobia bacterium]|jgi:mRNA-degrading endonuclease RelE of RelBE toxin-antitoxin system
MNISASWTVVLAGPARRALKRIAAHDRERIHAALAGIAVDPFRGDIKYLKGQKDTLRRRVGDWRIFFRLVQQRKHVLVSAIERRTSTTY